MFPGLRNTLVKFLRLKLLMPQFITNSKNGKRKTKKSNQRKNV